MHLGEIVRKHREGLGLTQRMLAEQIGVTQQTILNLENKKTQSLKLGKLHKLAEALHMPLKDVLMASGRKLPGESMHVEMPMEAYEKLQWCANKLDIEVEDALEQAVNALRELIDVSTSAKPQTPQGRSSVAKK
jgi:transcriptional regulator with XRE-family HTH domain